MDWKTGKPSEAGYYLVTCAPVNHAEIALERAQDYCETAGSSLAWYNPSNGWWRSRPGSKMSENINHAVTHWAPRLPGARPTAEQFAALSKRGWVSDWTRILHDISTALVWGKDEEALALIQDQLIPWIRERKG